MFKGKEETAEKIMKYLSISTEQVVAIRNYMRNHEVGSKDEIVEHMPHSLGINNHTAKLAIAMVHHGYI